MPEHIQLQAGDGHNFDAYIAYPSEKPKAGLVVLQEIFGVNAHIRSVADRFAQTGFLTIAPALFDRAERHVELAPDPKSARKGMAIARDLPPERTLPDIEAAITYLRNQGMRKVGVVGYCWGGTLAWLTNTRLRPDATVSYYGGNIHNYGDERPTCPAMFHFGLLDKHIPQSVVEELRQKHPNSPIFTYQADHAFNNDLRPSYNGAAANLALQRTLAHFEKYLMNKAN